MPQIKSSATWDDLRVLLALHRNRSFLAAGKALGVSTSTAARRIEALERSLGRSLVHRSSGGTTVEPDALELVALAEQLELGLGALKRDEKQDALAGTVRISMGEGFAKLATQVLSQLRRKHPSISVEAVVEARLADIGRREADIAIRVGKSSSAVVVERSVGRLTFGLYASQSYVDRRLRGGRLLVQDFARHDFVGLDAAVDKQEPNQWLASRGAARFVFRSNSDFALQEATEHGQGVCLLPDAVVRSVPGLVRLDVDAELPSSSVYLAFHRERRNVPRVRAVIDCLAGALRDGLR